MSVLVIAAIGIAIVLTSILVFRLHPLLSLLLASLFLLIATPTAIQRQNNLADKTYSVQSLGDGGLVGIPAVLSPGQYFVYASNETLEAASQAQLARATGEELRRAETAGGLSSEDLVWYTLSGDGISVSKGLNLVASADVEQALEDRWTGLGPKLVAGFTRTFRKLGIPVTMAAIVGICLLQSGAAARLVHAIIALFGTRGTAPALTCSGFLLGIPVFFDNVFYLLLPLAKAVGRREPKRFLASVMAIIVGASMAHSLVPPTPGPLFVAGALNVSVGMMMIGGFIVGSLAVSAGFAYGLVCGRWVKLSPDKVSEGEVVASDANKSMPLWIAAMPIGLPILLLGGSEMVEYLASSRQPGSRLFNLNEWTSIFNDPALIFIGAALVSITILRKYSSTETVAKSVAKGISDAGMIVLLTCSGGAFGASLQQLQIADAIGSQFESLSSPWGMLFTAFFLTTIIRGAQGSATVAMLTSSAIVAPVMDTVELPFHPLYVALAIGCGSKPLSWMNDSGFWQVTTMTGMTPVQTLKTFSVALTIMGLTGFGFTLLGAYLFPMV